MSLRLADARSPIPAQSCVSRLFDHRREQMLERDRLERGRRRCRGPLRRRRACRAVVTRILQRRVDPDGVVDPRRRRRGGSAAHGGEPCQHVRERQAVALQPPLEQRPVAAGARRGTRRPAAARPDRHRPSDPAGVRNRRTGARREWRRERSSDQRNHPCHFFGWVASEAIVARVADEWLRLPKFYSTADAADLPLE